MVLERRTSGRVEKKAVRLHQPLLIRKKENRK
jgi:hypothetical protein